MANLFALLLLLQMAVLSVRAAGSTDLPPPCPSEIYCHGNLLHTIQMAELYRDSKTFVDKKLRVDPAVVLSAFDELMNSINQPTQDELKAFVDKYFDAEGSEFEPYDPTDWSSSPSFLDGIKDKVMREWASKLHEAWKELGRKIKSDVRDHPELYSIIYLPHPFIVPGGRFREPYYWDSYWIVQGLLVSQMNETVRGMLENFLQLVETHGMIPNGGRIYYEQRSQPPMLISMVDRYITETGDVDFLRDRIHLLEKELQFWLKNRTVEVNGFTLARYNVEFGGPRPESYREDYRTAANLTNDGDKEELYMNLKSGAESGWDFSTRWFISDQGTNEGHIGQLRTRDIVPVDLNAFICMSSRMLSDMYVKVGNDTKAKEYKDIYLDWKMAIQQVLWNDEQGIWLDYDLINNKQRNYFYGSNIAPLWAGCYDATSPQNSPVVDKVLKYLEDSKATSFIGGVPTSMQNSKEQWDYPNAWPPLQHMLVVGLEKTGDSRAQALAFDLARKWLTNNYVAYTQSNPNSMFEKYDATVIGLPGGGGEYDVQLGFGWTNGVVLDFLAMYGDRLADEFQDYSSENDVLGHEDKP